MVDHPEYREVIQLQGDQRMHMQEFLVKYGLAREDQIKVIKCFIKILAFGMSTLIRPLSWKIVNVQLLYESRCGVSRLRFIF